MERSTLFQKYGQVVEAGRVIFREGEPGDTMYIIQSGRVKITKRVNSVEKILMVLGKGDFFGEMALIRQTPRSATATAVDTCELLAFNREGFLSMISKNSNIAMNIIEKLCLRLERADNLIRDLAKRDIKSLVLTTLNDLRKTAKPRGESGIIALNYLETINNISLQINANPKEVEDEIEKLINSGFIKKEKNLLQILDPLELERLAGYFKK